MKLTSDQLGAIKRFKPVIEGLTAVMALIDDNATLDSLQQAHNETIARLEDKRALENKIDQRLEAVSDMEKIAEEKLKRADERADEKLEEAAHHAKEIAAAAEKTAEQILDQAREKVRLSREAARKELGEIATVVETKRAELAEFEETLEAKRKEYEQLDLKLAGAKEHIALLLKGGS